MRRATKFFMALVLSTASISTGFAGDAQAKELKVGVVDVEYVVHNSSKGKAAKAKLKKEFESRQKKLDSEQQRLLNVKKELETMSAMTSDEKKRAKLGEYQQGLAGLQELYVKNQQELAKMELDLMKPILKSLEETLNKMAKDGSYDLIMNRSEQGVLFAAPNFDLTEQALKALN